MRNARVVAAQLLPFNQKLNKSFVKIDKGLLVRMGGCSSTDQPRPTESSGVAQIHHLLDMVGPSWAFHSLPGTRRTNPAALSKEW